jgi:hypothetical protein
MTLLTGAYQQQQYKAPEGKVSATAPCRQLLCAVGVPGASCAVVGHCCGTEASASHAESGVF